MIASVFGGASAARLVSRLVRGPADLASPRRLRRPPIARVIPTPSARRAPSWSIRAPIPSSAPCNIAKTLPLEDHEVVLTFDDGPLPKYSNQILDILAAHCAKATFFLVGRQANDNPEGVRKVRDAGHTVATHTQNHPTGMHTPAARPRQAGDRTGHRVGDRGAGRRHRARAVPAHSRPARQRRDRGVRGFQGASDLERRFSGRRLAHVSADRVYDLAIQRLEAKGKGILLLHDIQPRTVAALPRILHELKARGYRIVHVVPATPDRPATPTEPQQWQLHPPSEMVAISRWPKVPKFAFAGPAALPAPALSNLDWHTTDLGARAARRGPRRSVAARSPVAAANGAAASRRAGRAAGSGGEPFQNPGIDARDPAGRVPTRRATDGAGRVKRKSRPQRLAGKSRRHARAAAAQPPASAGHARAIRRKAPAGPPPSRRRKPNGTDDRFGSPA